MNEDRLAELKEKYKGRSLKNELVWGMYANHSGYVSKATGEFVNWLYYKAYEALYEKANGEPQCEWIDCKEPPSTDRNVFIAYGTDDMKSVCIGHYRHDMKLWYEDKNFFAKPIYDAMYWCEIPQFPTWMEGADDER